MKNKTLIVAVSEFTTLTRSKAFMIGILLMPIFMGIALGVQKFTRNATDVKDRRFVVVDRTGVLYAPLAAAAEEWNRGALATGDQTSPRFLPSAAMFGEEDDRARAELSDRVKRDDLYAFVEIPADALDPSGAGRVRYYSNHPSYRPLPSWVANTVNREIMNYRFREAAVDRALVARLIKRVDVAELGLLQRDAGGQIRAAAPVDRIRTMAIPVGMMM